MKNKLHVFGILGGFLGLLIAGVFVWDGKGNGLATALIAICAGVFVGYFIGGLFVGYKQEGYVLVKKMKKLNPIKGKHIDEILEKTGGYSSKKPITITDRNNEQGQLYKFVDGKYEVDILVGADNICIGILNEVLNGKKLH